MAVKFWFQSTKYKDKTPFICLFMWLHWTWWGSLVCCYNSMTRVSLTTELYVYCDLLWIKCHLAFRGQHAWFVLSMLMLLILDTVVSIHWLKVPSSANFSEPPFKPTGSECYSKHILVQYSFKATSATFTYWINSAGGESQHANPQIRYNKFNEAGILLSGSIGLTCVHKCPLPTMSWVRWTVVHS